MNTTVSEVNNPDLLVRKGWRILVEQLGIQNATQFVLLLERGKGDSIEEIAQYWGNSSIDDIYNSVTAWMSQTGKDKLSTSS
jgi:hypothetical protein